jgi:hypothetical protein
MAILTGLVPLSALQRCVPAVSPLRYLVPRKFEYTLAEAVANMHRAMGELSSLDSASVYYSVASIAKDSESSVNARFEHKSKGSVVTSCHSGGRDLEPWEEVKARLLPSQLRVLEDAMLDHAIGKHICILGPKVDLYEDSSQRNDL